MDTRSLRALWPELGGCGLGLQAQGWGDMAAEEGLRTLLGPASLAHGLERVARQILERKGGAGRLLLVGIRRGGAPVATVLRGHLARIGNADIPIGTVDITLYRDDAASAMPNPRIGPSVIPIALEGREVILVDDVISTGRTVRAALDAVLDFGRPRSIELAVVIDRGGRELPLQPDYLVRGCQVAPEERVDVVETRAGLAAIVRRHGTPSVPPAELPREEKEK